MILIYDLSKKIQNTKGGNFMEGYIVTKIKLSEERLREYTQDEEELREIKHSVVVDYLKNILDGMTQEVAFEIAINKKLDDLGGWNMITNFNELRNVAIDEHCPDLKERSLSYDDLIKILDAIIYEFPDVGESDYIKSRNSYACQYSRYKRSSIIY